MKIIPKLNGPVTLGEGVCRVSLPLTYGGNCPFAAQFPLEGSENAILTFETDTSVPAEGYRLTVGPERIVIAAWDENGAYYGAQTLFQLLREEGNALLCGAYEDAPKYRYRGFMLDVSRHFFPVEEVKKLLDQMAKLKLNTFHWHLSDDQGFRIESKKFPKLNEIGSWRMEDGKKVGGFYTQEEIRDVVAYAGERYIQVIPEIDLPGHTTAITAAYPELSCSGEPTEVETGAGIFPRILCGGSEKVYEFLTALLDEICPLFPSEFFHIGGDEAPKSEWEKCPKCQAEIKKNGLENEEELQALFTARLADILEKHGKAVIGWNEILASGKMKDTAVAQYWTDQGADYSAREIPKGRKFIFSNTSSFYFDYDHTLIAMEGTYAYEPHIPGGEAISTGQVLGLEAPLWTERVETCERLETMVFPRIAALAENAWTKGKDYQDFLQRVKAVEPVWKEAGIAFLPVEQANSREPAAAAQAILAQLRAWFYKEGDEKVRQTLAAANADFLAGILSPVYTREELQKVVEELKKLKV